VVLEGELAVGFANVFDGGIGGEIEVGIVVVFDVGFDHIYQSPRAVETMA
jgi:hypothetical protein